MDGPWTDYGGSDTATAEATADTQGPWTQFDPATAEAPTKVLPPDWKPRLDASQMLVGPDGLKRESGMESGTEMLTAFSTGDIGPGAREALAGIKSGLAQVPPMLQTVADIPSRISRGVSQAQGHYSDASMPLVGEERAAQSEGFGTAMTKPFVPLDVLKAKVEKDDPAWAAAIKEAESMLVSIPEFIESPLGILTMGTGMGGKAATNLARYAFAGDMVKSMFDQWPQIRDNWETMSGADKGKAITQFLGTGAMAGMLMHPELRGGVKEAPGAIDPKTGQPMNTEGQLAPDAIRLTPGGRSVFGAEAKPLPSELLTAPGGAMATQVPTTPTAPVGSPDMGETLSGRNAMRRPPGAPPAPEAVPTPPEAPATPVDPAAEQATPTMQRAQAVADMPGSEFTKAFPKGMNPENWSLGETATAPEVEAFKGHLAKVEADLKVLSDKSKAGTLKPEEMQGMMDLSMKRQYFSEAIQAAPKEAGGEGRVFRGAEERAAARAPNPPAPTSPAAEPTPPPASATVAPGKRAAPANASPQQELQRIADKVDRNEKLTPSERKKWEAVAKAPEQSKPEVTAGKNAPLGFGGGVRPPKPPAPPAADPTPGPTPATPEEVSAVQTQKTPGLLGSIAQGIKSLLLPSSKGPASLRAAELLGSKLGPMHRRGEASASQLRPFSRLFDKLGVDREGVSPADNKGIKFMSDMSQGRPLTGRLKEASDLVQRMFTARLDALEKAGAALQTIRENYFPGMWTRESRLAFNAAMERMGKDFDVNKATPEQRAAIKAQVDKFLADGTGSEKDALGYLTRKPIKGKESFRKQKVFEDIMDGAEFGLRPISNNPIDLVMLKLSEMDKSIMANEYFQALKARGELKIINPYEEVPKGWVKINDKYGTIYGKPTVTVPEYIDKAVYQGLLKVAADLGINHERLMKFPPGPGQSALGLSYQGQNRILSRFGTETSVIAHEIGHQLDVKYGLWDLLTGGERGSERNSVAQKELRAIADETERGKKARKKEEKMAQVMEAYIHAPDKMREIAPTIFAKFDAFVKSTPELKAFADIKPGLALENLSGEKYVGLPILGYRIVPDAHGEIVNNYLSSSLYNNRYFGSLYKGWMAAANILNQTQLGVGSMFHAGFTTIEAQISSNANVLKDIYGVLRGNRSAADLGKTIAKSAAATIRTPVIGDRVLNAWRNPDGQINPKIAQVVRAAELGGGGFKMESGLRTEQSTKLLRDWYSGHRLRAAARSPIALTELLAKPTMEWIVPRQKAGVFADIAWRIIERNPGKTLEELTHQFRQAWNRDDARLGQVRYDRLFINNTAKNVVQGLVRAPGWSGGTIAEIGGGFADAGRFMSEWVKTGKLPEDLPDRTAYVISLLTTVSAVNASLTYAFTGTQPHGLDFFAFRTGHKDDQGREERFLIPSYVKDMLAYARHPGETLLNKSHPLISLLSDISKNKDYYGVEIIGPDDSLTKQAGQTAAYVAKGFEPFWTRGARREMNRGTGASNARTVAPFFGVMPAPRSVTQTSAENLAHDLMMQQIPSGARTKEQADRSMAKSAGNTTPYLDRTVKRLNAVAAVRVYEKANAEERARIADEVESKIANSKTLSEEEKDRLRARITRKPPATTPPWEQFK